MPPSGCRLRRRSPDRGRPARSGRTDIGSGFLHHLLEHHRPRSARRVPWRCGRSRLGVLAAPASGCGGVDVQQKCSEKRAGQQKDRAVAGQVLDFFGSPTWARTRDLRINSPALYRLSYRGREKNYSASKRPKSAWDAVRGAPLVKRRRGGRSGGALQARPGRHQFGGRGFRIQGAGDGAHNREGPHAAGRHRRQFREADAADRHRGHVPCGAGVPS